MPATDRPPTDVVADDLVRLYAGGARRLDLIVRGYLNRGLDPARIGTGDQRRGDATAAYRERQRKAARAAVTAITAQGTTLGDTAINRAYTAAVVAVDRVAIAHNAANPGVIGRFAGIHHRTVEVLAGNLRRSLERAAGTAGTSIEKVFERAAALEGPIPAGSELARIGFIGRRQDDPWRRVALETIGVGQVSGDTRRQISATLIRQLQREGVTDALTGFIDRNGRRWSLHTYAEMVARTTTREATSRAVDNRLAEHGLDLIAITSHPHLADECSPYDGRTFARQGTPAADAGRYPVLLELPPFHPRCRHVAAPAVASFDEYLGELERAAGEGATLPPEPARAPAPPTVGETLPPAAERAPVNTVETVDVAQRVGFSMLDRKVMQPALDLIRRVHKFPAFASRVSVRSNPGLATQEGAAGMYTAVGKRAHALQYDPTVNRDEPAEQVLTLVHELGHYIDHQAITPPTSVKFASEYDPDVKRVIDAIEETDAIKRLRRVRGTLEGRNVELYAPVIDYLLDPREQWARAYTQLLATESGDDELLLRVTTERLAGIDIHWDRADFNRVRDAMLDLLKRKGLRDDAATA